MLHCTSKHSDGNKPSSVVFMKFFHLIVGEHLVNVVFTEVRFWLHPQTSATIPRVMSSRISEHLQPQ